MIGEGAVLSSRDSKTGQVSGTSFRRIALGLWLLFGLCLTVSGSQASDIEESLSLSDFQLKPELSESVQKIRERGAEQLASTLDFVLELDRHGRLVRPGEIFELGEKVLELEASGDFYYGKLISFYEEELRRSEAQNLHLSDWVRLFAILSLEFVSHSPDLLQGMSSNDFKMNFLRLYQLSKGFDWPTNEQLIPWLEARDREIDLERSKIESLHSEFFRAWLRENWSRVSFYELVGFRTLVVSSRELERSLSWALLDAYELWIQFRMSSLDIQTLLGRIEQLAPDRGYWSEEKVNEFRQEWEDRLLQSRLKFLGNFYPKRAQKLSKLVWGDRRLKDFWNLRFRLAVVLSNPVPTSPAELLDDLYEMKWLLQENERERFVSEAAVELSDVIVERLAQLLESARDMEEWDDQKMEQLVQRCFEILRTELPVTEETSNQREREFRTISNSSARLFVKNFSDLWLLWERVVGDEFKNRNGHFLEEIFLLSYQKWPFGLGPTRSLAQIVDRRGARIRSCQDNVAQIGTSGITPPI
ncbi:MAG: hypothetical protein EA369_08915 [Bradymonadales bacterium]|nr:MAG: hypothetical protein EA369_08915 [Bradymonadales bacterium]